MSILNETTTQAVQVGVLPTPERQRPNHHVITLSLPTADCIRHIICDMFRASWEWTKDMMSCFDFLLVPLMEEDMLTQFSIALVIVDRMCSSCLIKVEEHLLQQQREESTFQNPGFGEVPASSKGGAIGIIMAPLVSILDRVSALLMKSMGGSNDFVGDEDVVDATMPPLIAMFGAMALVLSCCCIMAPSAPNEDSSSSAAMLYNPFLSNHAPPLFRGGGMLIHGGQYHTTIILYTLLTLFCMEGILLLSSSILLCYTLLARAQTATAISTWTVSPGLAFVLGLWMTSLVGSRWLRRHLYRILGD